MQALFFSRDAGVSFSDRALKHGQIRRAEGKGKEADDDQKQKRIAGKKRKPQGGTAHLKAAGGKEGDQDAEREDQDVHNKKIPSQNAGVSKKSGQYEIHPQQYAGEAGGQETAGGLEKNDDLKQRIDEYGEEKKLQMLPDGFVNRGKQGDEGIFPAPFIAEMQQGAGSEGKQDAGGQVRPFADFHGAVPPLRI